jgi:probable phosphoglycerate mutase
MGWTIQSAFREPEANSSAGPGDGLPGTRYKAGVAGPGSRGKSIPLRIVEGGFYPVNTVNWKAMTGNLFEVDAPQAGDQSTGWFTAHCDGGSRGNPGPAGYGAVVEDNKGRVVARLNAFLGTQTNNYAEYAGLLAVLKWAAENSVKRLRVVSDSALMVNQMKGQYRVASPGLRPLWEEARQMARRLDGFEITHTLRGGNKEADRLANEAMDRGMGKDREQGSEISDRGALSGPGKPQPPKAPRQVLEGYVKGGVVHLLEGELPEGIFVKVVRE